MKTTILNQRAERDELLSRPYQQRHTKYDADDLLQNPLIKLITGLQVLEGEVDFTIERVRHHIRVGDSLLLPPFTPHSVYAPKPVRLLRTKLNV